MSEKLIVACPACETRFVAPLEKFLPNGRKVRCAKCGHAWFQNIDGSATDIATHATTTTPNPERVAPAAVAPVVAAQAAPPSESIMDRAAQAVDPHAHEQVQHARETGVAPPEPFDHDSRLTAGPAASGSAAGVAVASGTASAGVGTEDVGDGVSKPARRKPSPEKRRWLPRVLFYTVAAALIAGAVSYFFKDEIVEKAPDLDPPLTSWKQNVDAVVSKVIPPARPMKIENVKYDINEVDEEPALLVTADVLNSSAKLEEAPKLVVTLFGENNAILEKLSLAPEDLDGKIEAGESAPYFLRMPYPPEDLTRVEVDFAD